MVGSDEHGMILGKGRPMNKLMLLMLTVLIATASLAKSREWQNSHGPNIPLDVPTKIAIEGKRAYILDANAREVKLHIAKKTAK
jgi:hypothetical protein